jgi:hypothetical protein
MHPGILAGRRCTTHDTLPASQPSGDSPELVTAHLSIYRAIREGRLATVTDTVERVLERKPITFDEWVRENATSFR